MGFKKYKTVRNDKWNNKKVIKGPVYRFVLSQEFVVHFVIYDLFKDVVVNL